MEIYNNTNLKPIDEDTLKKMVALGYGAGRPIRKETQDITKRWFDDKEIIEFTDMSQSTNHNAEFTINNDSYFKIWFSQLEGIFFTAENDDQVGISSLKLKNIEKPIKIISLTPQKFYQYVKNKKFRVSVESICKIKIDTYSEKFLKFIDPQKNDFDIYKDAWNFYFKALKEKRYDDIKGLTKAAKMYNFEEI